MQRTSSRQSGIALLTVAVVMITMFGATASVVMVLSSRARALTDRTNETGAFYLAEAGVEVAKYEIARTIDRDGDGVGNLSVTTQDGNYVVTAQDLGGGVWQITSVGAFGDHQTTIEAVVGHSETTRFPAAAATFLGDFDKTDFKFKHRSNVLIDGGNMPAFVASSPEFYEKLGGEIAYEIVAGNLSPDSIVGDGSNTFMPVDGKKKKGGGVKLPKDIKKFLEKDLGKNEAKALETALTAKELSPDALKEKLPSYLLSSFDAWQASMTVQEGGVELPIQLNETYADSLTDLTDIYDTAISNLYNDVIPGADFTLVIDSKQSDDIQKAEDKLTNETAKLDGLYTERDALQALIAALEAAGETTQKEQKDLDKVLSDIPKTIEKQGKALQDVANAQNSQIEDDLVYGTLEAPVTVYLSKKVDLKHDGSITGYGTLVIDDKFKIHTGSSLDWYGDVIVVGNEKKHAKVDVHGGNLNISGNLMILGYGDDDKDHVKFEVDHLGYASIDGSVFMSTSFTDTEYTDKKGNKKKKKNKAELKVKKGELDIDGLFTMLGQDIKLNFGHDSDVSIHGMWQIATPQQTETGKEKVKLKIDGNLEIVYDQEYVEKGVGELQDLGTEYELPGIETGLFSQEMEFYSWRLTSTKKTNSYGTSSEGTSSQGTIY